MLRTLFVAALIASASAAGAQPVAVTLTEFKIGMTRDTVKAGPVTFRVKNSGVMAHAFYVIGDKIDKGTPDIPAGQEASLTLTLKAGTYEVFCPMSDNSHKLGGMTRKLVVTPGDAPVVPKKPGS
ncbi:MAG: cupredoxin domain-containing protein [Gemmatimonadaceae bacterium]|nr:cupredoxin domain-containing protein [Gemmatimonadaceae bacterium]